MDKASIGITITVVVALGFVATGGTGIPTDISSTVQRSTEPIKEAGEETAEKLKEVSESGSQVIQEVAEKTKDLTKEAKE